MKGDLLDQFVLWKPIKVVSVITYALILLIAPFSQFWATVILFGLICFWSRIPCLISMFTKDLEVIDFFTVVLAIHVGGLFAGIFGGALMLFTRLFGPREWYLYTIKDAISIFICGLFASAVYAVLGSQLYTLYAFTLMRYVLYIILTVIMEPEAIFLELGLCAACIGEGLIVNTIMNALFESRLDMVMADGVQFNFGLFIAATLVIGVYYLASRFAKWIENRRMKKVEAGEAPAEKPKWYEFDADKVEQPMFTATS
jgi:hypothetical protein